MLEDEIVGRQASGDLASTGVSCLVEVRRLLQRALEVGEGVDVLGAEHEVEGQSVADWIV